MRVKQLRTNRTYSIPRSRSPPNCTRVYKYTWICSDRQASGRGTRLRTRGWRRVRESWARWLRALLLKTSAVEYPCSAWTNRSTTLTAACKVLQIKSKHLQSSKWRLSLRMQRTWETGSRTVGAHPTGNLRKWNRIPRTRSGSASSKCCLQRRLPLRRKRHKNQKANLARTASSSTMAAAGRVAAATTWRESRCLMR